MSNNIQEHVKVNDTVKGFFTLVDDKTGKIIISKHNTITLDGRKFIFKKFYDSVTNTTDSTNESLKFSNGESINQYNIAKLVFGSGNYSMTTDLTTMNDVTPYIISDLTQDININSFVVRVSNTDISMSLSSRLANNSSTAYKFNSIAIVLSSSQSNSNDALFSRITIDDIYLSPNRTYTLTYSIYF